MKKKATGSKSKASGKLAAKDRAAAQIFRTASEKLLSAPIVQKPSAQLLSSEKRQKPSAKLALAKKSQTPSDQFVPTQIAQTLSGQLTLIGPATKRSTHEAGDVLRSGGSVGAQTGRCYKRFFQERLAE